MSISDDTDDLLATTEWGEVVTIVRNTPSFGDTGVATDSWASIATPNADIQPLDSNEILRTSEIGEVKGSSHKIFFPNGTDIKPGDRVRGSGWSAGSDEYEVQYVMSDEGHVEVFAKKVEGNA